MATLRPNLLVLRVASLADAARFYQEALGLPLVQHRHGSCPLHYAFEGPAFTFELYPLAPTDTPTTNTRIGFDVPVPPPASRSATEDAASGSDAALAAVAAVCDRVAAAGGEVVTPVRASEWGPRAVVRDLDGHKIELVASPSVNSLTAPPTYP